MALYAPLPIESEPVDTFDYASEVRVGPSFLMLYGDPSAACIDALESGGDPWPGGFDWCGEPYPEGPFEWV